MELIPPYLPCQQRQNKNTTEMSHYANIQHGNAQSQIKSNARKAILLAQKWGDTSTSALWDATKELIFSGDITDNDYPTVARMAVKLFQAK